MLRTKEVSLFGRIHKLEIRSDEANAYQSYHVQQF